MHAFACPHLRVSARDNAQVGGGREHDAEWVGDEGDESVGAAVHTWPVVVLAAAQHVERFALRGRIEVPGDSDAASVRINREAPLRVRGRAASARLVRRHCARVVWKWIIAHMLQQHVFYDKIALREPDCVYAIASSQPSPRASNPQRSWFLWLLFGYDGPRERALYKPKSPGPDSSDVTAIRALAERRGYSRLLNGRTFNASR